MQETEELEAEGAAEATQPPRSELRYPLAFDANGNPIKVPPEAVAWRVRRGGGRRGRPRNVFDASTGRQLEIALGASIEDLAQTNVAPDRYLLYPIDAQGCILPGLVAVTEVTEGDDEGEDERDPQTISADSQNPLVYVINRQQETIKGLERVVETQSGQLANALGSTVSGYAPVRPVAPAAPSAPIVMAQPAAPQAEGGFLNTLLNIKPEQMLQIAAMAKHVLDVVRGTGAAGGPTGAS